MLFKAKGKCTTDHISPAGPWLRYRGHLDNITDNMFIGAHQRLHRRGRARATNLLTGENGAALPTIARALQGRRACAGSSSATRTTARVSSREHAAMEPRYLGGAAVIVRSFARIHETNLKKQGMLPLTFAEPGRLRQGARGRPREHRRPDELAPGKPLKVVLHHADGGTDKFACRTPSAPSRSGGSEPARH